MVVVPVEPAQVVVDVDRTALSVTAGIVGMPTVASAREAVAVELAGEPTVVTLAHSTWAPTSPVRVARHGVVVVDDDDVEMAPVSGVGATLTQRDAGQGGGGRQPVGPSGEDRGG